MANTDSVFPIFFRAYKTGIGLHQSPFAEPAHLLLPECCSPQGSVVQQIIEGNNNNISAST